MFLPARTTWPKESVDCILPKILTGEKRNGKFVKIKPSDWLKQTVASSKSPGCRDCREVIEDSCSDGGWKDHPGAHVLNPTSPAARSRRSH
jgi:hypothetical protein